MDSKLSRYKDFCVREVWMKDAAPGKYTPRVPLIVDEQYFQNACRHPDTYYSIKRYPIDARMASGEQLHEFDSVSGLFFDIDGHANGITIRHLVTAAVRLGELVIKELDLSKDELMTWWSGRGVHLCVPPEIIMASPTCGAEQNYKLFAEWCKRTIKLHQEIQIWNPELKTTEMKNVSLLDTSIYHRRALIRIPDTANSKSRLGQNLKKTFMPFETLQRIAREPDTQEQINLLSLVVRQNPWKDSRRWV